MTTKQITLERFDADEGKVFDWAVCPEVEKEDGTKEIQHLYAKTIFLAQNDSIENYIEVEAPVEE